MGEFSNELNTWPAIWSKFDSLAVVTKEDMDHQYVLSYIPKKIRKRSSVQVQRVQLKLEWMAFAQNVSNQVITCGDNYQFESVFIGCCGILDEYMQSNITKIKMSNVHSIGCNVRKAIYKNCQRCINSNRLDIIICFVSSSELVEKLKIDICAMNHCDYDPLVFDVFRGLLYPAYIISIKK